MESTCKSFKSNQINFKGWEPILTDWYWLERVSNLARGCVPVENFGEVFWSDAISVEVGI
jgi:hypothetical protein